MSPRAVGPQAGGEQLLPWLLPATAALAAAGAGALWVAGGTATLLAGAGWRSAPVSTRSVELLLASGPEALWPDADPRPVLLLTAALLAVVLLSAAFLAVRLRDRIWPADDPQRALASRRDLAGLQRPQAAERARRLRPTLTGRRPVDLTADDTGVLLGTLRGRELFASWEDVTVALMAPRSGKTTCLAVPAVLAAPGAVVLTSNKAEGWKETAALRAADTGEQVWTFDPQQIARTTQTWWWNPLRGVTSVAEAGRLAGHFVATVQDDRRDIWGPAATELLATLLLAAACSGHTVLDVYSWLADETSPVPAALLRTHGHELLARTLQGTQDSPPETRGSVYFTARAATACLRDPHITAWITPPANPAPAHTSNDSPDYIGDYTADYTTAYSGAGPTAGGTQRGELPGPSANQPADQGAADEYVAGRGAGELGEGLVEFVPDGFPTSRQTLYLLSKDEGGSAGPLVAALTDRVLRCGIAAAERAGGRLDPPLLLVLDEAANICRIADLPQLYSHLGSRGVVPITILQSYSQAVAVWGETGTRTLWGAATVKLVGAGTDDPAFAEDLSRLVGDHDVLTSSLSRNTGGRGGAGGSRSLSTRQQRILPASAVRELPKGTALLMATGTRPALITLQPWYTGPRADQISAAEAAARHRITHDASSRVVPASSTAASSTAAPAPLVTR